MSQVVGIIAEYNPFHNGHAYHIAATKKQTGAGSVVAVISGNFAQRGNTSIIDKWEKTKMALLNGADLVIELPTIYSVSSAENFAEGAIKILNDMQIVDTLSFGTEIGDISTLNNIANVLCEEPKRYINLLNHELGKGVSYPKARENALLMYLNDIKRYANVLSGSNNILGIEYLKAIKRTRSNIRPFAMKREKVYYNSDKIVDEFASATAIRRLMLTGQYDEIRKVVPTSTYEILCENIRSGKYVLDISKYEKEIIYLIRRMSIEQLRNIPDVEEGLEHLIKEKGNGCNNLIDLVNGIKSKRYTQTRIQRILIYILLNISKEDMLMAKKTKPYIRVLGFNQTGRRLLSEMANKNKKLNIITSVKKYQDANKNKSLKRMLDIDIFATNTYTIGFDYSSKANLDYTNGMIISNET